MSLIDTSFRIAGWVFLGIGLLLAIPAIPFLLGFAFCLGISRPAKPSKPRFWW